MASVKKVLCLFGLFPKEYEETIEKDTLKGKQNAANILQWAIVDGLSQIEGVDLSICNSLYIGSYPSRYRKMLIPTFEFQHNGQGKGVNVGFINLKGIKFLSKYIGALRYTLKWIRQNKGEDMAIIGYAMTTPFVEILAYVKKHHPEVKCYLVVPDLPEYMNLQSGSKKRFDVMKKMSDTYRKKTAAYDGFVLLTEQMKNWFKREIGYTVVEGIAGEAALHREMCSAAERKKSIVYAGMLEKRYGVEDLVKAFIDIQPEGWSLDLFGSGSDSEELKRLAEKQEAVCFHGLVPNSTVLKAQKYASLLVNPRRNEEAFTQYSFPSKTIEYMASGTPMLAYKLDGMPKEYEGHFYDIEELGGLTEALKKIISMSYTELEEKGNEAQEFIREHKNAKSQCEKIVRLMDGVVK